MKRLVLLGVALLFVGVLTPAADAGVVVGQGSGKVTFVHDGTYGVPPGGSTSEFAGTLCLEGEVVDADFRFGDIVGPTTVTARPYTVDFFQGTDQECVLGEGDVTQEIGVADGADLTVGLIWPTDGLRFAEWTNNPNCVTAGTARVTLRHGATTGGPVDVIGTVGGSVTTIVSGLAEGAQASLEGPAGVPITDVAVVPAGGGEPLLTLGTVTLTEGTNLVVYVGGGNDGPLGAFTDTIQVGTCTSPTTPTIPTTAAPTTAPAAQAAAARPRFTG